MIASVFTSILTGLALAAVIAVSGGSLPLIATSYVVGGAMGLLAASFWISLTAAAPRTLRFD